MGVLPLVFGKLVILDFQKDNNNNNINNMNMMKMLEVHLK